MRKIKTWLLLSIGLLTALTFGACSADSEDGMSTAQMKEFSTEELQQIYQIQEDYGVSFDFPKKSDKQLPSMEEMEDLCKFVASMNASKSVIEKKENSLVGTAKLMKTRSYSQSKEVKEKTYNGYHCSSGTLEGDHYSCTFQYEIKWSNLTESGKGSVVGSVKSINSPNGWDISEDGFSYNIYQYFLEYTFSFSASTYYGYTVNHLSYHSSVSFAVQG